MADIWMRGGGAEALAGLGDDIRELVTDALGAVDEFAAGLPASARRFPAVEVYETAEGYRLVAELPGLHRDEVELSIDGPQVRIEGERPAPEVASGAKPLRRERPVGRFRRTVRLPEPVDPTAARARLEAGLLTVDVPRPPERRPQKVEIETEEAS